MDITHICLQHPQINNTHTNTAASFLETVPKMSDQQRIKLPTFNEFVNKTGLLPQIQSVRPTDSTPALSFIANQTLSPPKSQPISVNTSCIPSNTSITSSPTIRSNSNSMGFTTGSIPFHSQPLVQERSQSFSHYPDIANLARPLPPLSYQTPAVSGFPVVSSPGISYPPLPSNTVRSPLLATAQQHQQTMYNNSPVNHKQQFHIQHPSYTNSPYQPQPQQQHNHHRHQLQVYQPHQPTPTEPAYPKFNRVLPVSQISKPKRQRRKAHEMLRLYACTYPQCSSSYGTLNHLNAHIQIKKHGNKRRPEEFKELREVLKNGQMEKWSQAEILKWVADVQRTQRQGGMG